MPALALDHHAHWICLLGAWICLLGLWICLLGVWICLLGVWICLLGVWTCLLGARRPDGPAATVFVQVLARLEKGRSLQSRVVAHEATRL